MSVLSIIKKKNRHILVQNGAAFLGLIVLIVTMTMTFVYYLIFVQVMNDEGMFMYFSQLAINHELSEIKTFPELEKIWQKEAKDYAPAPDYFDVVETLMAITERYGFKNPYELTPEVFETMTEQDKKDFANQYYYYSISVLEEGLQEGSGIMGPVYVYRDGDVYRVLINGDTEKTLSLGDAIIDDSDQPVDAGAYIITESDVLENFLFRKMPVIVDESGDICYGIVTQLKESDAEGYLLLYANRSIIGERPRRYVDRLLERIVLLIVIAAALYGVMFYLITVKPLVAVKEGLQRFTETRDADRLLENMSRIKSKNEIGRLTDDIKTMGSKLKEYERAVQEQARAATELALASEIQFSMLPDKFPDASQEKRFEIYASMKSAKEVGGDLYDFFFVDDDHLVLEVGDVSGKGVPAALFMMMAKTMVKDKATMGRTPGELLREVNEELITGNSASLFITIGLMVVELSTGKVTEVNAGHMNPVILSSGGKFEMKKECHSMVVGIMEGMEYEETHWQLKRGDKIFIYSDGVTEAENEQGQQFGNSKLVDVLNEVKDRSQKDILEHVAKAVAEFEAGADQSDDLTMLGFTYFGVEKE
jgi:serine phosphatase RsbU (regulator of sigma subunit)